MKKIFLIFRRWELNYRTRKKLVATASRREGVLGRAVEPSVTFLRKRGDTSERPRYGMKRRLVGAAVGERQGGLSAADKAGHRKRAGSGVSAL